MNGTRWIHALGLCLVLLLAARTTAEPILRRSANAATAVNESALLAQADPDSQAGTDARAAEESSAAAAAPLAINPPTAERLDALAKRLEQEPEERRGKYTQALDEAKREKAAAESFVSKLEEIKTADSQLDQRVADIQADMSEIDPDKTFDELGNRYLDLAKRVTETTQREREAALQGEWTEADEAALKDLQAQRVAELDALERMLAKAMDDKSVAEQTIQARQATNAANASRVAELDEQLQELPTRSAALTNELANAVDGDALGEELRLARIKWKLTRYKAESESARAEVAYLKRLQQLDVYNKDIELRRAEVALETKRIAALQPIVERGREGLRAEESAKARDIIATVPEQLRDEAKSNLEYAEEANELDRQLKVVESRNDEIDRAYDDWQKRKREDLDTANTRSLDSNIRGMRLRGLLSQLPSSAELRRNVVEQADEVMAVELRLYLIEGQLDQLQSQSDPGQYLLSQSKAPPGAVAELKGVATELADARMKVLQRLKDTLTKYRNRALLLIDDQIKLARLVDDLRSDIYGKMLWTRSHPNMLLFKRTGVDWIEGERALLLFQPQFYVRLFNRFAEDVASRPVIYLLMAVFAVLLLITGTWLHGRIRRVAQQGASRANTSVVPLLRVVGMTIAEAAVWPALLAFLANRTAATFAADPEIALAAAGLKRLALALFLFEFVRAGCLPGGAAELLGFPADAARFVRAKVCLLEITAGPLAAMVVILHADNVTLSMRAVERICFVLALVCVIRLTNQMLRRTSPVIHMIAEQQVAPWLTRFRPVFWFFAIAILASLIVLSIIGYHNSAIELLLKLESTLWFGLGLLLVRLILSTLILLHRRRLRFAAIRRHIEENRPVAQSARRGENAGEDDTDQTSIIAAAVPLPKPEDDETAVERLTGQSQRLIGTMTAVVFLVGVYLIWTDLLPALAQWQIYPLERVPVDDDGNPMSRIITLGHVFAAIAAVALTITAARNLPALIEFSVLERVGVDRSVRYAFTTILSYVISLLGLIVAGSIIGLQWNSIQWMAAGLSVGLGFGLQEIIANFVSGLIIFVEQPIRVGDIVTIDDVTGVVSRIRIRATTITNWDRKEYIVPNREFITGRLLNWTLSDTTNRLVLHVGVAYGSDTEKARELLLEIVKGHEEIMDDPGPLVTLEELGDNSVNFVVRCYLPTLDNRLAATHELYSEIHKQFGEAGIEIPFPQRDIWLRAVPEGFNKPT